MRTILVTETDEEAATFLADPNNNVTTYYRFVYTQMSRLGMLVLFQPDLAHPKPDLTLAEAMDAMVIAGSPETVTEKLRRLYADLGGFGGIFLAYHDRDDRPALWERSYRLFKELVVPALESSVR